MNIDPVRNPGRLAQQLGFATGCFGLRSLFGAIVTPGQEDENLVETGIRRPEVRLGEASRAGKRDDSLLQSLLLEADSTQVREGGDQDGMLSAPSAS